MKQSSQEVKYYSSSFANFLAALGGGMILGKGMNIIDHPFLREGSILAFFIGTVFGLFFLKCIPKRISNTIARSLAIMAGLISLILIQIYNAYSIDGKLTNAAGIAFFILLSARFGFWFYSRVLRAASVAGLKQKIAWVELGYYLGIIGGLIVWNFFNITAGITTILIIDAVLQLSAGLIDLSIKPIQKSAEQAKENILPTKYGVLNSSYWRLASSVVLLTIGTQVVIFTLSHEVTSFFASYILATYYVGVATAAYVCKLFNIQIDWETKNNRLIGFSFHFKNIEKSTSIYLLGLILVLCMMISTYGIIYLHWGNQASLGASELLLLIFITLAAFVYEIFALALLDKIGLNERITGKTGQIIRTYGFMGIGAAVSFWMLEIINNSFSNLFIILLGCFVLTSFFIQKENKINL